MAFLKLKSTNEKFSFLINRNPSGDNANSKLERWFY